MANQQLPLNNQTQAVLSKYGITAPKKITNIQNIQNKTETDIKIVQPDIKVSQPQINISPVEQAAQRYRQWIGSAYDRQKQLANKQKEDLREKEFSLSKNINALFRKIEELTSQIVDKGHKFKQKMDSSMTPLIALYVSTILPMVWKPLMNRLDSIEKGFRYLFFGEVPTGEKEDENSFSFVRSIRKFLGMDDKEGKNLFQGIGDLISEGIGKVIDFLKIQKEDRAAALVEAQKADIGFSGILDFLKDPEKNIGKTFQYLGGLFTAAFGGSDAYQRRLNRQEAIEKISKDDSSILDGPGKRKGKFLKKALSDKTPQATYYLSDQASKYLKNGDSKEYQKLQFLLSEIDKLSKREEGVVVSEEFLRNFLGSSKFEKLKKNNEIKEELLDETYGDYLMNSSQNEVHIGKGKYKKRAYNINNKVFKEIIGIDDFYSKEGTQDFYKYLDKKHKNFHKKEVKKGDKGSESIQKLQDQSLIKEKKLKKLETEEKYSHFNNLGTVEKTPTIEIPFSSFSQNPNPEPISSYRGDDIGDRVIEQAKKDIGKVTYKYGGKSYTNTDCSGYVSNLYKKFGVSVPAGTVNIVEDANKGEKASWIDLSRDENSAYRKGKYIPDWNKLRPGDIMVWSRYGSNFANNRGKQKYAGHVSLYTGEVDEKGKPIIIGNPGPEGAKGIRREKQDLSSYLGAIRYNAEKSNIPSTISGETGDGEKSSTLKMTPSFPQVAEKVIPTHINQEKDISISKTKERVPVKNNIPAMNINETEAQYKNILSNVETSIENCKTSVSLKKAHAEKMIKS